MPSPGQATFHRWLAPDHWRAIDFVSDLHLCAAMPRTFDAWSAYLESTTADAVVILGDLFEVWVGDDARAQPFERGVVEGIAAASGARTVCFMAGNRDFLVGTEMLAACGMEPLPDPTCLEAWGRRIVLSHGDALCLSDHGYQAFRAEVRRAEWQAHFLARPLAERLRIAGDFRRESMRRREFDGDPMADLDRDGCLSWMRGCDAGTMIHGHTHRPGNEQLAPGAWRFVLSDWDVDDATPPRAEVLQLTREGVARLAPRQA